MPRLSHNLQRSAYVHVAHVVDGAPVSATSTAMTFCTQSGCNLLVRKCVRPFAPHAGLRCPSGAVQFGTWVRCRADWNVPGINRNLLVIAQGPLGNKE
jgi:hypothetical protein